MNSSVKTFFSLCIGIILIMIPKSIMASTLNVEYNEDKLIDDVRFYGILADGTILGFDFFKLIDEDGNPIYDENGNIMYKGYLGGAITESATIVVPDSIVYEGKSYSVGFCGSFTGIDFKKATSVTSLILGKDIYHIYALPESLEELHIQNNTYICTLDVYDEELLSVDIYVPQSAYEWYISYSEKEEHGWSNKLNITYEGWTPIKYTVHVAEAGTLLDALINEGIKYWQDIEELAISGQLNENDIALFEKMNQIHRLDLSGTNCTSIGGCENRLKLRTVVLPNTIKVVEENAFEGCFRMEEVSFPESLERIEEYAFCQTGLTSITIPKNCQEIGFYAFSYCPIKTITLLYRTCDINWYAFKDLDSTLETVLCYAVQPIDLSYFGDHDISHSILYVPLLSVDDYASDEDCPWDEKQIMPLEEVGDVTIWKESYLLDDTSGLADTIDLSLISNESCHIELVVENKDLYIDQYIQHQHIEGWGSSFFNNNANIVANSVSMHLFVKKNCWNFISFPYDVNVSDIKAPQNTQWVIRRYSGEKRAAMRGETWIDMTKDMELKCGEGYILHCSNTNHKEDYIPFDFPAIDNENKNNIFTPKDVVMEMNEYPSEFAHNSSWNLLGNPYPTLYATNELQYDGIITVWNGDGYLAYSTIDDNYLLKPSEAFFIQCPENTLSVTFGSNGRLRCSDFYAPTMTRDNNKTEPNVHRKLYNFILSDIEKSDRARLVVNEEAQMEYEIGRDANKFMSHNTNAPQIYIYNQGVKYAIDERPLHDGTITLGVSLGVYGSYTISLSLPQDTEQSVILMDKLTARTVDLTTDSYTFTANAGTDNNRFVVKITDKGETTITECCNEDPTIQVIDGLLCVRTSVASQISVTDVLGRQIGNTNGRDATFNVAPGEYVVKVNDVIRKIAVRDNK